MKARVKVRLATPGGRNWLHLWHHSLQPWPAVAEDLDAVGEARLFDFAQNLVEDGWSMLR